MDLLTYSEKLKILEVCNYGGDNYDVKDVKDYFASMIQGFTVACKENKQINILKSDENKKLLSAMVQRSVIKDYHKARGKEEFVIVH